MWRALMGLVCAAAVAAGQEVRTDVVSVEGPRPLALAAEVLTQRHGWAINYEDPAWMYAGDLEDRTDPNWRLQHPDVQHRMLIPKPGRIYFLYEVDAATGQPKDALAVLQALVEAHGAQGNPGLFRVVAEGAYFSIVPSQVRDAQGRWTEAVRVLDTAVSFPAQLRSVGEALELLDHQIEARTGRKFWPAGVGANFMALDHTLTGAAEEAARVVLRRIVDEPAYGPSGSTLARRMVWHAYYQEGWGWGLNLRLVPSLPSGQPVARATVTARGNVYRVQGTPSHWFDQSAAPPIAGQPTPGPQPAETRPYFVRERVIPFQAGRPRLFAPGMIVAIYGEGFAACQQSIPQNGPYPTEACGVRVMVGGSPAALLYVGEKQINLKLPADAPEEGSAPITVCLRGACSDPVTFGFSSHKAYLSVDGTAYVHMPVWIRAEQPMPYEIYYPYSVWPWNLGGYTMEVRRNGMALTPLQPQPAIGHGGGTVAPEDSPRSRLPLHVLYRFAEPGTYSVRFTAWKGSPPDFRRQEPGCQSDWTEIVVEPLDEARRDGWLAAEAARVPSATPGELVGDLVPSLLAWPDEKALAILAPLTSHSNDLVRQFATQSLAAFDPALVQTNGTRRAGRLPPPPVVS